MTLKFPLLFFHSFSLFVAVSNFPQLLSLTFHASEVKLFPRLQFFHFFRFSHFSIMSIIRPIILIIHIFQPNTYPKVFEVAESDFDLRTFLFLT